MGLQGVRGEEAVSYTHLDVYKRQPVDHPDAVITGDKLNFTLIAMQAMPLKEALDKGMIKIEGNRCV